MVVATAVGVGLWADARETTIDRGVTETRQPVPARPTPNSPRLSDGPPASRTTRSGSGRDRGARTGQGRLPLAAPRRPVPQAARDLLSDAGRGLGRAIRADQPADRYAAAHLAALRGAAAVLATKARPGRSRQASAWELLAKLAPEFSEWAAFFAAGAGKRQAAEAGIARFVNPREADDMVRQCAAFLDLVEAAL